MDEFYALTEERPEDCVGKRLEVKNIDICRGKC